MDLVTSLMSSLLQDIPNVESATVRTRLFPEILCTDYVYADEQGLGQVALK